MCFSLGRGGIFVSGSLVTMYVAAISFNKKAPEKRQGACWGGAVEKREGSEDKAQGLSHFLLYLL